MSDILTGTPPDLTYAHELVRQAWMVVWAITTGALVVILGWMGLSFIVSEHLGRQQTGWREMVPRLVLGLVAAASSLWWCALVLDVADAVSGFIAVSLGVTPGDLLRAPLDTFLRAVQAGSVGMAQLLALLYLVYGFFVLYVIVQMVLRLALIDILLALAPIALGLWILPHTAGWGRHWLRLFMTTVFQQAVQLIALALGIGFLNEFASVAAFEPVQDLIWKLLMSLAFVYMATRVPSMMGNAGTFDSWLSMLYFGMNLPSSLMRSARTIGLMSGAAGGPGRHGRRSDCGQRGGVGGSQRPELGGLDGDPIGRGRRRRSAQEQRGVARPRQRNHTGADDRAPTNTTTEAERCAANGAYGLRPIETSGTLDNREEQGMEDLTQTISNLVGILLGIVGAVGVGFFIYGAYLYLTASGAPHQMERGKSAMMTALAGIVLALVAYGVVELVMNAVVDPGIDIDDVLPEPEAPGGGTSSTPTG